MSFGSPRWRREAALSKYETGRSEITLTTFLRVCEALEVMPSEILPLNWGAAATGEERRLSA